MAAETPPAPEPKAPKTPEAKAPKAIARAERAALCDLFDHLGPDAPTLCVGWSAYELALHLWIRESDPIGASGLVARPLAAIHERRIAELRQRWSFADAVDKLRRGPHLLSVLPLPGLDDGANAVEFLVHHEDLRRGGDAAAEPRVGKADAIPEPRELEPGVEEWIWRRLKLLGRAWFRRSQVGVVLERSGGSSVEPETLRAAPGSSIVTLVGRPSELLLFANGRVGAAIVTTIGEDAAIQTLLATDLRV